MVRFVQWNCSKRVWRPASVVRRGHRCGLRRDGPRRTKSHLPRWVLIIVVLVPFRRMTADHATCHRSKETVTGGMTGHTPDRRAFYAAFSVGGSSRECECERQDGAAKSRFHQSSSAQIFP